MNSDAEKPVMPTEYQAAILTLSDGRTGTFMGPVLVRPEDTVSLVDVKFVYPKPLPPGLSFAPMEPAT